MRFRRPLALARRGGAPPLGQRAHLFERAHVLVVPLDDGVEPGLEDGGLALVSFGVDAPDARVERADGFGRADVLARVVSEDRGRLDADGGAQAEAAQTVGRGRCEAPVSRRRCPS